MAYATTTDVETKWRPLTGTEPTRVQAFLDEADALLDHLLPDLAANITAGDVSAVLARMVVTNAVIRVLANPAGVTMQTVGPESYQFAGIRQLGTVAFTDDELALLQPVVEDEDLLSAGGYAMGSATVSVPDVILHQHGY